MRIFFPQRTAAFAAAGLLILTGCATPPPPPPAAAPAPTVAAAPAGTSAAPAASPAASEAVREKWADSSTPDAPAWKLLEKVVEAMGGAAVIDRIQTLVLTGKIQQRSPLGE